MTGASAKAISLAAALILPSAMAGEVDAGNSLVVAIPRSGEEARPAMGEPLAIRITLKDDGKKPVAGVDGAKIRLFVEADGKMSDAPLNGKSASDGTIYSVFRPDGVKPKTPVKFAAMVGDELLQRTSFIEYKEAAEHVDQGQPLWNGTTKISPGKPLGQTFVCGNVSSISRIKVMLSPDEPEASMPILKLYEWTGDYESAVAAKPLAEAQASKTSGKELATYKLDVPVKPGGKYYFELSSNTGSVDAYRTWSFEDGNVPVCPDAYPEGMAFLSGLPLSKGDLMFYTLFKSGKDGE